MNDDHAPGSPSTLYVDFGSRSRRAESGVAVRRNRSGRWLVLAVKGEMDLQVVPLLAGVGNQPCYVVFDLGQVTFMDCSSLHALSEARRRALAAGGSMRLAAASWQVLRTLKLTGLDRAFPVFDTVEEAISLPVASG